MDYPLADRKNVKGLTRRNVLLGALLLCLMVAFASAQTVSTLVTFDIANGADPFAGLVQGVDGNFYGTTQAGGTSTTCTNGCGTVFKVTSAGALTTLHGFDGSDGASVESGLVLATNGNFYGTTYAGGANKPPVCVVAGFVGCGTVFEITPAGTLTTLHNFDSADGSFPSAGLVQATNGDLYGTTNFGGASNDGTVFKVTPTGTLTTLHSFNGTDGFIPNGTLIQASDGNFYGTTAYGGNTRACTGGCGTIFKITPAGDLTTLYTFNGAPYGPYAAALVQGTDGNFYGTTQANLVFKITPRGVLTTLFTFDFTDGFEPLAGLLQATNGNFYGTTYQGTEGYGTIFSLATGLGAFVKTNPTSGEGGTRFMILGDNLTGATSVNFNGIEATFSVVSSTEIEAKVPSGATSGFIYVLTPHGTFKSNVKFRVP